MGDATVIDQLVVKLGLDPSGFTKGQKAAAAALVQTEQQAQKSSDNIGRSFASVAGKFIGITTAIVAVKKLIGAIDDVSESVRRVGINADNFGLAANKLRNFQNAAELVGGSAEEMTKTIGGLQKSIFDLSYNGEVSQSLIMLGRLGVRFQDAGGHARDFQDILLDTADALGKSGMSRSEKFNYLQEAGFDQGSIQLALLGRTGALKELDKQSARNQITDQSFKDATTIQRAKINVGQAAEAELGLRALRPAAALIEAGEDPMKVLNTGLEELAKVGELAANGVEALVGSIDHLWGKVKDFAGGGTVGGVHYNRSDFDLAINAAAKRNGIDPAVLAGVIDTESKFNPNAINGKSGARGIAQLNPKYFPQAGQNPVNDINTAAQVLAANRASFMRSGSDENTAWEEALMSYNDGETRVRGSLAGGKALPQETQQYPGKVLAYAAAHPTPAAQTVAGGGASSTQVEIGSMTVNTRATDADGIASGIDAALQRKLMASHSEQGVQ